MGESEPSIRPEDHLVGDRYDEYRRRRYFSALDGIRCIAIIVVVWHHTVQWHALPSPVFAKGFLGVDLFFVLSGYLIVTLLLRERDRNQAISLKKFYMRRVLRIFPLYYGLVLGVLALLLVTQPRSTTTANYLDSLPLLLTYTCNWVDFAAINMTVAWSLAVEEQFYMVWPAVEKFLKKYWWAIFALIVAVSQASNFGLLAPLYEQVWGEPNPPIPMLQATFMPIALGVALAHLLHDRRWYGVTLRIVGWRGAPFAIFVAILIVCATVTDVSGWPRLTIHLLMTAFIAALVVHEDRLSTKLLRFPLIVRIGVISYGIYLLHMWGIHICRMVADDLLQQWHGLPLFVAGMIAAIILAELSYRFYETPFLNLKSKFSAIATGRKAPENRSGLTGGD